MANTNGTDTTSMNGAGRDDAAGADIYGSDSPGATTSPGGSFSGAMDEREGFANHPHFAEDGTIEERSSMASGRGSDVRAGNQGFGDIGATYAADAEASAGKGSMSVGDQSSSQGSSLGSQFAALGSRLSGGFNQAFGQTMSDVRTQFSRLTENAGTWPQTGREIASKVDTHARSNPWLHVGIAGASALIVGYLWEIGRAHV